MAAELTFQDMFIELCRLLGATEDDIIKEIGEADEIQTDETGKKYLLYDQFNAMFTIPSDFGVAELLACPIQIDSSRLNNGYYNFMAVDLRFTRDEILSTWGQPTGAERYVWAYNNKTGTTHNGFHYESRLLFNTNDEAKLIGFGGMLYDFQPQQKKEKPAKGILITILQGLYSILDFLFVTLSKLGKWLIRKALKQ
jgi:hypothetical protein